MPAHVAGFFVFEFYTGALRIRAGRLRSARIAAGLQNLQSCNLLKVKRKVGRIAGLQDCIGITLSLTYRKPRA